MTYALPWYDDRDLLDLDPGQSSSFTAQDYTLAYALGVDENHRAEHIVRRAMELRYPSVAERITWDSELGCFFAHTSTRDDMQVLVKVVADLVSDVNPNAVPGSLMDSPAALRQWNRLLDN